MDPEILKNLREGNTDHVLELLQNNPTQIGCVTVKGNSIFHIAASHGIKNAFSRPFIYLLDDPNGVGLILHQNDRGDTILHCAARNGNPDILISLISYYGGTETERQLIVVQNERGDTALHEAARCGHADTVCQLVDAGPEMAAVVNRDGESPLYLAAKRGAVEAVEKLLGCSTVAVEGPRGQTALHAAVCGTHATKDIATKLLEIKSELNKQVDDFQSAPIHFAASLRDVEMVRLLLQKDASVAHLLDNEGFSAIHIAASQNYAYMIEEIVRYSPDATKLTDTGGRYFLHVAVNTRAVAVVKLILKKSLLAQSINEMDNEGNTPLHLAVKNCSLQMVRLLLSDNRIDANVINCEGLTPIDIASSNAYPLYSLMDKISLILALAGSIPRQKNLMMRQSVTRLEEELKGHRKIANNLTIVAVLIAIVTFSAAFTLPGGYAGVDSIYEEGTAILSNDLVFNAFLIFDTIAMISSNCAIFLLIQFGSLGHYINIIRIAKIFLSVAVLGMSLAFSQAIALVVLSKHDWLGLVVSLICFVIPSTFLFIDW